MYLARNITNRSFLFLYGLFCLLFSYQIKAQTSQVQIIVSGSVALKSTSSSAVREARPQVLEVATKNAWRLMSTRPEFVTKVQTLPPGAEDQIIAKLTDECIVTDIDQEVDKDAKRLTSRFRFDCRTLQLQNYIASLQRNNPNTAQNSGVSAPGIVFLFFAEKVKSITTYDPNVTKSDSRNISTNDNIKGSSSVAEKEEFDVKGSANVAVSDKVATSGASSAELVKTKVDASGKSSGSASLEVSQNVKRDVNISDTRNSSGSTVQRSADIEREISRPDKLDAALKMALQTSGKLSLIDYSKIRICAPNAPKMERIQDELRKLKPDQALTLTEDTQIEVIRALRGECGVSFLAIGVAKINTPSRDPITGNVKVSVDVTASVDSIKNLTNVVSVTKQVSATGQDETEATNNALTAAANIVGQETLSQLSAQAGI
jgi:hypothetical protein